MIADFAAALRSAAPYIHQHRDRIAVVHLPGDVIDHPNLRDIIFDLALARSLGLRLVLVFGARPQIDARLEARDIVTSIVGGQRITSPEALTVIKEICGALRSDLEALLSTGLASTPMGGAKLRVAGGNLVTAKPVGVREGRDLQFTGEVRRVDVDTIRTHLDSDRIVLLPPLGYSATGETFNVRSEDVALAVACALRADKLLLLTVRDVPPGEVDLTHIRPQDDPLHALAASAIEGGVARVHGISCGRNDALLRELYTRDGGGLMVTARDYDNLRAASIDDVGGLLRLIEPLEQRGVLVPRSREQLELDIEHFAVLERDGSVIGCRALFPYPDGAAGELACVVVHPDYQQGGRAARLLASAEQDARKLDLTQLFVLTTHAAHWFIERGFEPVDMTALPAPRQQFYNYQRNSQVLRKFL